MDGFPPKRRARFRKGFVPPPLISSPKIKDQKKSAQIEAPAPKKTPDEPPSIAEIEDQVRATTLDWLARQFPDFWVESIDRYLGYKSEFLPKLRFGRYKEHFDYIKKVVTTVKFPEYKTFTISVSKADDGSFSSFEVKLKDSTEWVDAISEARRLANYESDLPVARRSQDILKWAASVPLGQVAEYKLENESYYAMTNTVRWVEQFDPRIYLRGNYQEASIHVSSEPIPCLISKVVEGFRFPVLHSERLTKEKLDAVAGTICDFVLGLDNTDGDDLVLLRSGSRFTALPFFNFKNQKDVDLSELEECLDLVDLPAMWFCSFLGDGLGTWHVFLRPKNKLSWPEVRNFIREKRQTKPCKEQFGLSHEAGALLEWLLSLSPKDFERGLSPEVESNLKLKIGFRPPWDDKNWPLFFELICEEITEKTPYKAKPYPWYFGAHPNTRIRFARPAPTDDKA